MGDYFKDRKDEEEAEGEESPKRKGKKQELIKNFNQLIATYAFENERYQHTIDKDYKSILPAREALMGAQENTGMIADWKNEVNTSKLRELTLVKDMRYIVKEIENLALLDVDHIEEMENHAKHYQFICDSAIGIIKEQQEDINQLIKENEAMKAEMEMKEVEPEEQKPKELELDNERKEELEKFYGGLSNAFEFAGWVNPRRQGRRLSEKERDYLREYNKKMQKFVGMPRADKLIKEGKEQIRENVGNDQPSSERNNEPPIYSPLSQKQTQKKPLSEEESEKNPEPDEKSG